MRYVGSVTVVQLLAPERALTQITCDEATEAANLHRDSRNASAKHLPRLPTLVAVPNFGCFSKRQKVWTGLVVTAHGPLSLIVWKFF